ncbi:ActS/PrrB/RegB family redox-sensitive histidine kinase [Candidatus Paracaedibacter symbiosus]|uniref:ActS/PrrB/RegB family redox-sensitive histidine kinase n=1 Tax=Candidatus Paracaedibacter symbiosus TaxID=244582 RepID=UPI00068A6FC0|nr:ActS/PrrB/RegB family redox-sensitive histidine kinase [Candidatus Paracaedibacter symbiosus]
MIASKYFLFPKTCPLSNVTLNYRECESSPMNFSAIPIQLLISLRWIAVAGQLVTILVVYYSLGFTMPIKSLAIVLLLSLLINGLFSLVRAKGNLIPEGQAAAYLLYDLGQLTTVLYLTGGLNNPFGVLLLAPVVVAAGFLPPKKSLILYLSALGAIGVLAVSPYPLPWETHGLELPLALKLSIGIALSTAIVFIALYIERVAQEGRRLSEALHASNLALAREQRLASLGALAAAAAHELGSPLTTISLITQDLLEETPHHLDLQLIGDQVKHCRQILVELAQNFAGEKTLPYDALPVKAALQLIATRLPENEEKHLVINVSSPPPEPILQLTPELVHGLNNILQNGWQFAQSSLSIEVNWDERAIHIIIADNGPGYPESILGRLGEPYVSGRSSAEARYHLGLGLFIAQALLAKIGGTLYFKNQNGARCEIQLPIEVRKNLDV